MRRLIIGLLTTAGCLFIATGLLLNGTPTYAQDDEETVEQVEEPEAAEAIELEYVGADECSSCHRDLARRYDDSTHALALQDVERDKDPILADFDQGEDVRMVQFPEEDEPRAFTEDDIVFAIGAGRYTQKYVYEVGRREYQVFPAQWNTVTQQWEPYQLTESWPDPAYDFSQNCAGCHTVGLDEDRERWEDDGVQCEACHGPGSAHIEIAQDAGRRPSDEELVEVRGAINRAADPQVCGQCHSRGMTPEDSPPFPTHYQPGGTLIEDGTYTLFPPDDADHWYATGQARLPNMQFNEWYFSGHPNALTNLRDNNDAKDECLACHSQDARRTAVQIEQVDAGDREGAPPDPLTVETAQFGVTCTTCHNPHSEAEQPFNLVDEPYALCVSCHSNSSIEEGIHHPVQEMFEGVSLVEGIEGIVGAHFSAEDGPNCQTCHLPRVPVETTTRISHSLTPIMPGVALGVEGLQDSCSECHAEQVEPAAMQKLIDDVQADVRARLEAARTAVKDDSPVWIAQALDMVEGDGSAGVHNYAYTKVLLDAAEIELGIKPAVAPTPDMAALFPEATPVVEPTAAAQTASAEVGGLTTPSIIILAISGLIIAAAAVAFFGRRSQS